MRAKSLAGSGGDARSEPKAVGAGTENVAARLEALRQRARNDAAAGAHTARSPERQRAFTLAGGRPVEHAKSTGFSRKAPLAVLPTLNYWLV